MKKLIVMLIMFLTWPIRPVFAFDLWQDIQQKTEWRLGDSVAAGTSIALRHDDASGLKAGQFVGSALAQFSSYRMLSAWAGGTFVPKPDQTLKATETVKIGLNLGYFLTGFVNQPPVLLKNLVIGPSLSMPIWTTPHVVIPFFDINFAFGGTSEKSAT